LINGKVVSFPTESIDIFDVFSVRDKQLFYNKVLELFSKNVIVSSIPGYLEVNFRIMAAIIYIWPTKSKVFYFRNLDACLLAANGPRIKN